MINSFCFCLLPRLMNPLYYLLLNGQTLSFLKRHVFCKLFIAVYGCYKQFSFRFYRHRLIVYLVRIHVIAIENIIRLYY